MSSMLFFHSGETLELSFEFGGAMVARTDIFPNWYVAVNGTDPRIVECTRGEHLHFVRHLNCK